MSDSCRTLSAGADADCSQAVPLCGSQLQTSMEQESLPFHEAETRPPGVTRACSCCGMYKCSFQRLGKVARAWARFRYSWLKSLPSTAASWRAQAHNFSVGAHQLSQLKTSCIKNSIRTLSMQSLQKKSLGKGVLTMAHPPRIAGDAGYKDLTKKIPWKRSFDHGWTSTLRTQSAEAVGQRCLDQGLAGSMSSPLRPPPLAPLCHSLKPWQPPGWPCVYAYGKLLRSVAPGQQQYRWSSIPEMGPVRMLLNPAL